MSRIFFCTSFSRFLFFSPFSSPKNHETSRFNFFIISNNKKNYDIYWGLSLVFKWIISFLMKIFHPFIFCMSFDFSVQVCNMKKKKFGRFLLLFANSFMRELIWFPIQMLLIYVFLYPQCVTFIINVYLSRSMKGVTFITKGYALIHKRVWHLLPNGMSSFIKGCDFYY